MNVFVQNHFNSCQKFNLIAKSMITKALTKNKKLFEKVLKTIANYGLIIDSAYLYINQLEGVSSGTVLCKITF